MNKFLIIFMMSSALLFSCGKNKMNANGKVYVRIENLIGVTMDSVVVGTTNYGTVIQRQITDYKILEELIYAGYCLFMKDSVQSMAGVGVCGTPLPPPFEAGYYTFEVKPAFNGYNALTVIRNYGNEACNCRQYFSLKILIMAKLLERLKLFKSYRSAYHCV
jgi:hypothetical protein